MNRRKESNVHAIAGLGRAAGPGAGRRRERMYPPRLTTVARATRWAGAALALAAAACGGRPHHNTYQRATMAEQRCCESLAGPARDQCLQELVRVPDPGVQTTSTNQATFECVEDHFVCDPSTGHATQPSAQAQLDCIQDLAQR